MTCPYCTDGVISRPLVVHPDGSGLYNNVACPHCRGRDVSAITCEPDRDHEAVESPGVSRVKNAR